MKTWMWAAAATLALGACGGEPAAEGNEASANEAVANETSGDETAVATPAEPAGSIEGNLALTAVSGQAVPDTVRITGSASGGTISLKSPCAAMSWPFTLNGNLVAMGDGSGTTGGCAGDRTTYEYAVAKAVSQANIAMFQPGEVMLSGPGGSITLAMN